MEKVTYNGEKGFWDENSGFTSLSKLEKVTYKGQKGYWNAGKELFIPDDVSSKVVTMPLSQPTDISGTYEPKKRITGAGGSFETGIIPAFKGGYRESVMGLGSMIESGKRPADYPPYEPEGFVERQAMGAGQILGDIPAMVTGGLVGSLASPAGTLAGAFALPLATKKLLRDKWERGEVEDIKEFGKRLLSSTIEAGKGIVIGRTMGLAGKVAPTGLKTLAEALTLGTVPPLLEARIPTKEDYQDSIALLFGAKTAVGSVKAIRTSTNILKDIWNKHKIHPKDVVEEVKSTTTEPLTPDQINTKLSIVASKLAQDIADVDMAYFEKHGKLPSDIIGERAKKSGVTPSVSAPLKEGEGYVWIGKDWRIYTDIERIKVGPSRNKFEVTLRDGTKATVSKKALHGVEPQTGKEGGTLLPPEGQNLPYEKTIRPAELEPIIPPNRSVQLTDFYNRAKAAKPLEPLAEEARKYGSAEEFVKAHEQSDLLDLSNPKAHKIGRIFSEASGTGIKDLTAINKIEKDSIPLYPEAKVPITTNPEQIVTIYRSAHSEAKGIEPGDYVSFNKKYASSHDRGKLIKMEVPAKDVIWQGNDLNEWVYSPETIRKQYPNGLTDIYNKAKPEGVKGGGTTLEFGGFQTLYEKAIDNLSQKGRLNELTKGFAPGKDIERYNIGQLVQQRYVGKDKITGKPLYAPPIFQGEKTVMEKVAKKDIPIKPLGGVFETTQRLFDHLGEGAKQILYYPAMEAFHNANIRTVAKQVETNKLYKGENYASRKAIMLHALAQEGLRGKQILDVMGERTPTLTPKQMDIYKTVRSEFENYYTTVNKAREQAGVESFGKVENYFTFMRDLTMLQELGYDMVSTPARVLEEAMQRNLSLVHRKATYFPFTKRAKEGGMEVELDSKKVFERYFRIAEKHIALTPMIAKARELTNMKFEGGKSLAGEAPQTYKALTKWIDHLAGQKIEGTFGEIVDKGLMKLNKNLAFAVMSFNIESMLKQPAALNNAFVLLGPKYLALGVKEALNPSRVEFARRESKHLSSRGFDVMEMDALAKIRGGRYGDVKQAVGEFGMLPLQFFDIKTADATWLGAYRLFREDLGFSHAKAVQSADSVVIRTQASASPVDIAPIQRTPSGKFVTAFQTFAINDWNFFTRDVLGIRDPNANVGQSVRRLMSYLFASTAINILYNAIGMESPNPQPVKEYMETRKEGKGKLEAGAMAAYEMVGKKVPVVGGARFGRGLVPGLEAGKEAIKGRYMPYPSPPAVAKVAGIPGTQQVLKSYRAAMRKDTPYGTVLGRHKKKEKRSGSDFGSLESLGGL